MAVTVKQIFTKPSLHDMFWFELLDEKTSIEFNNFVNQAIDIVPNVMILTEPSDDLRPDINDLIKTEMSAEILYNPLSTSCEFIFIFDTLSKFREENSKLYESTNSLVSNLATTTNNTISEKVYDENNVFLENGLFNQE
jgi:hypothetical protein